MVTHASEMENDARNSIPDRKAPENVTAETLENTETFLYYLYTYYYMTELTADTLIEIIKKLNYKIISEVPYGDYKTQHVAEARIWGQIKAYNWILETHFNQKFNPNL